MDGVKDNDKIITTAKERFNRCYEAERENRLAALDDLKFSLGEQWDEAIRRARENDPKGARPCLTVDKLDQYIRQVVNDARQNKPSIKPRPKDSGADVETAEVLAGIIRHIEDQSSADIAYDTAAEMCTRAGFGYIRVVTDYCDDDSFDQDIYIKDVSNPFSCSIDPNGGPDGSKAKYGFAWEDMPRDEFEEAYPDADQCDFETLGPDESDWIGKETVRVCEYFEVKEDRKRIWQAEDGSVSEEEIKGAPSRESVQKRVVWRKITARDVLEESEWLGKYIPIVPVYGHRIDVAGKQRNTSMIRAAIDAQRMYNYAASAFVERVALTPKAPYMATPKQLDGFEGAWETANTANHSVLPYNPDPQAPPPQRQQTADIPSGWMSVMQGMEHDIQGALGQYNASVGAPSNEKSGKAIIARQHESDVATFHIIDNLARAIRQVGRIVIDLIPKIYDTERVIRILGEDGTEDFAEINPSQEEAKLDVHDVTGKKIKSIYNPGVGRYDVTVSVGPAYSTKRQEATEFMTQIVQSAPDLMPIIGDLMFKSMDMPYADDISDRMKKMLPPQLQGEEEQQPQIPPEMQQQMEQMSEQVQKLGAALEEASKQLDAKDMEFAAKNAEIRLKERELTIKEFEAETKRADLMRDAMNPADIQQLVMDTIMQLQTTGFDEAQTMENTQMNEVQ